jgi:DNA-directed RNA polymerase specialized sigma24 family protein
MTSGTIDKLEAAYRAQGGYVLGVLARRSPFIRPEDRQAVYHDAFALVLEKARCGRLDVDAMRPRQLRAYLTKVAVLLARERIRWGELPHTHPLTESDIEQENGDEPAEERVADGSELAVLREIVAELPERQRAVFVSESIAHRGTLRALRLPEHPPALRRALDGRGAEKLRPEQVPNLVPSALLRRCE